MMDWNSKMLFTPEAPKKLPDRFICHGEERS